MALQCNHVVKYCGLTTFEWRSWWRLKKTQKKQVAIAIQTVSLFSNLSLPSSVNNRLQRDKRMAGKLMQGSHCESQMCVRSPSLSSPQQDGNSRLWHCHNFASLLQHSLFFPPPLSFHSRGAEVIACDTLGREKRGKNCITPQSRMPWEQDELYLLVLNNSGII